MSNEKEKIVISGCGFSGMITALAFAHHSIPVTVLEKGKLHHMTFDDIRTTAITADSQEFFQKIGIWNRLKAFVSPIKDIYIADNKANSMVHFASETFQSSSKMGYIIENRIFKECLLAMLLDAPSVSLYEMVDHSVSQNLDNKCVISIEQYGEPIEADLLILCDGNKSPTKEKYFTNSLSKDYKQYALTFLVRHDYKHNGTALEHFLPAGPFAVLPLMQEDMSSIVWTVKKDMKDALLQMPIEDFAHAVESNFGPFLGKVEIKSKIASYPLRCNAVQNYFNKRIVVVGDSAHVVHPLAGQGLNQGIKDIKSLVSNVLNFGINSAALQSYQSQRKADNEIMLFATDFLNELFSNNSNMVHNIRQSSFSVLDKITPFKKLLIKYGAGKR